MNGTLVPLEIARVNRAGDLELTDQPAWEVYVTTEEDGVGRWQISVLRHRCCHSFRFEYRILGKVICDYCATAFDPSQEFYAEDVLDRWDLEGYVGHSDARIIESYRRCVDRILAECAICKFKSSLGTMRPLVAKLWQWFNNLHVYLGEVKDGRKTYSKSDCVPAGRGYESVHSRKRTRLPASRHEKLSRIPRIGTRRLLVLQSDDETVDH